MQRTGTWLVLIGIADLLAAVICFLLWSLAFTSQYTGFTGWIAGLIPGADSGTAKFEEVRLKVLWILGRTEYIDATLFLVLAATGISLIILGLRLPRSSASAPA